MPKLAMKRLGVISDHFESAAFRRAFRAKRTDNDVPTRLNAARDLPDICSPLLCCGKKMEYRAIMPEVVRAWFQFDFR